MNAIRLWTVAVFVSAAAVAQAQYASTAAADRPQALSSHIPALLLHGKTVFLANGGADAGMFPHPFSGTPDRAYNYLYGALAAGHRFQLVEGPGDADLVFQIELTPPNGPLNGNKVAGASDPLPTFKLTVYDRPTHYVLWTVSQTVDPAALQKTHDRNFDGALDSVLQQLMMAAGPGQ